MQNAKQKYILETMLTVTSFQEKLKKYEVKFNDFFPYFKEGEQMEEILKKKILIIFLNDRETSKKCFENLKKKVLILIEIMKNLSIICRYFLYYYPNINSEDIKIINNIFFL